MTSDTYPGDDPTMPAEAGDDRWTAEGTDGYGDPVADPGAPPVDPTYAAPVDPTYAAPPDPYLVQGNNEGQFGNLGYAVDIVFVIDITGSMTPVIDQVKAGALSFHDRLLDVMGAKDKYVSSLRLRVVAYRDYLDNPSDALFQTPFFQLPDERAGFDAYVQGLYADGGGDEPESGLEGLALALQSDWERGLDRRRHVVVLFTDASAHPLEAAHGRHIPGYPAIPATFDDLTDTWDDPQGMVMEFSAKRLLMYAPDVYPWNVISASWDNVLHYPSTAGRGLNEVEFGQIVDAIAGSV
ncbi:MAG: von Willebrand factor type [Ilumatobacteraceae bacterium]|nr:von Willebrand factor type [Ilumatobacteraceae bacterium]